MTTASDGPFLVQGPYAGLLRSAALWPQEGGAHPPVLHPSGQPATTHPATQPATQPATHPEDPAFQDGLIAAARRHALLPALHRHLSDRCPDAVTGRLTAARRQAGLRALGQAAALGRILAALRAAGVDTLVVKGLALSQMLYGTHDLRPAVDIDLLVAPDRAGEAHRILLACGYVPLRAVPVGELARLTKDALYRGEGGTVELHWRLMRNRFVLPWAFETLWAERETVSALGIDMPTLSRPRYAVFLALHGVHHGWERLRWLADVALLLWDPADARRALAQADADGVRPVLLHALGLSHLEFAMPLLPEHRAAWLECRRARALDRFVAGWSRLRHSRGSALAVMRQRWWQRRGDFLLCFTLQSGIEEIRILFRSLSDRDALPLPASLAWLYPILRPGMLAARVVGWGYGELRHRLRRPSR